MDLFSELQTAVLSDLTIGTESTQFNTATVKLALNRAYNKAGSLHHWPETESAKKTGTVAGQEYYDYPPTFEPDSAWKLEIDDDDYGEPLLFKDYLYEKENNRPLGLTKMWSSQWRRIFIYPTPTATGSLNLSIWGHKSVDALVNDSDVTIFSYAMRDCNDAIVQEAVAILKTKGEDKSTSAFLNQQASLTLERAWMKIKAAQSKYQKTTPMITVPDFFPPNRPNGNLPIGNFNL